MMNSVLRLVTITLVLLASSVSADVTLEDHNQVTKTIDDATTENIHRQLDTAWTKTPTGKPSNHPVVMPTRQPVSPTRSPTSPTNTPTRKPTSLTNTPTREPISPTNKQTFGPTETPPPACGNILTNDGNDLTLGPFKYPSDERKPNNCNTGTGAWFAHSYYAPMYMYAFQLTQRCEYQFRTPEGNLDWQTLRDVNSWFEQAAKTFQRPDNVGYKVSDDDIIFSGLQVPNYGTDLISENIEDCPEKYCVKVVGPSITRKSLGSKYNPDSNLVVDDAPELLYAFSNSEAHYDFYKMMRDAMRSSNKKHIFLTNHFLRCECESFCMDEDEPFDEVHVQATCYVEELCGERVFQIAYTDDYPNDKKATWASTGTTQIMEWFDECAFAMYGCTEIEGSDKSTFRGTYWNKQYEGYPKVFQYHSWNGANNVYGLGGDRYDGFPFSTTTKEPQIAWTCPTYSHKTELRKFGELVASTQFMRDAGLETSVPAQQNPCEPEVFNPPEPPELPPPVGPKCEDIHHVGYCYQMPGATCYAATAVETCSEVDFVMINETSTYVYGDVAEWTDACIGSGTNCKKDDRHANDQGTLLYTGAPYAFPLHIDSDAYEWYFLLGNFRKNGVDTLDGYLYYNCDTWEGSYGAQNFTVGAADRFSVFGNTYGDLFEVRANECTSSPTNLPSESPTLSLEPSTMPSLSPTMCSDSYLTSENLNIALVVDLSYSTYEKQFSSTIDIGDVNGDGKGNTILDAQVFAIQDLLMAISVSEFLDNSNCEIELISFETDAKDHSVWKPLTDSGDSFNPELMEYIKNELRAPTSSSEVFQTNNGFTNFDAALDVTVEYFENTATPNRKNLLVFLSDGEPNVRGDGDNEEYCSETTTFWNGNTTVLQCADLGLAPGERHTICRGDDPICVEHEPYQDCVRGPTECMNAEAVTQYESEIGALIELNVERLAIGVGDESNIASGSALWMIDNNPAKDLGVLPLQALNLEELTVYLSSLCILNTDSPTGSPSASPSESPSNSPAPSVSPTGAPTVPPIPENTASPTDFPEYAMLTPEPTTTPSGGPTNSPTTDPTRSPTTSPTTSAPSSSPTASPSSTPTAAPTVSPTVTPSEAPSGSYFPSSAPTNSPTKSLAPSSAPTGAPSGSPTRIPTASPTIFPTVSPTASPTDGPTITPTVSPTPKPTLSFAPTYVLPDCYEGPKMVQKDSSSVEMCYYNQDMVQINEMNTTEVTLAINNVWTQNALPEQMRIFIHNNGIDAILDRQDGDGFQCLDNEGSDIDIEGDNEFTVDCYQESEDAPWLAVIDIVITDDVICGSNDVPHPCFAEEDPILESCSWRIVVPCGHNALCKEQPTSNPTDFPTVSPTASPTDGPTITPTVSPTPKPTLSFAPTYVLPDCYEGPKMVQKDSSSVEMCYYNQDMVQINEMNTTEVTLAINNVWTQNALPERMRIFIHNNGIDAILDRQDGDGFQCLDNEGSDIDIEGDNEFTVDCYQESEDAPWLAVIDIVITDDVICGSNDVPHPCFAEEDPILESCSWRIVVPCGHNALCKEQPTSNPTDFPTVSPTASPNITPTARQPTGEPTSDLDRYGEDDDTDDLYFPPIGPQDCPDDMLLVKHTGVTSYPKDAVRIVSQDKTTVTVELTQTYTDLNSSIDNIYYQYQQNHFSNMCYEEQNLYGKDSVEITIECTVNSQIALLELWVADDIAKGVLSEGDNAIIPDCCHPTVPEKTPVTKYMIEIKCVTECPEVFE